jgi:exonuclease SbcD
MKIIHTADLHIGRRLKDVSLIDDQKFILNEILKICIEKEAQILLISGDIYDRSIPSTDAVELFQSFLEDIISNNIKVIIIPGNHDSSIRLSFMSSLMWDKGLYILGIEKENFYSKVTIENIVFYGIPYISSDEFKARKGLENRVSFDQMYENISNEILLNSSVKNILLAHAFIIGASTCESERVDSVGESEAVSYEHFSKFDYVALGHLHRKQRAGLDNIVYSGSPLKYSFDEQNHVKGVWFIDVTDKLKMEFLELSFLRDVRVIKGKYKDILNYTYSEDYIHVILTDKEEIYEPMIHLREKFPNVLSMEILRNEEDLFTGNISLKNKSFMNIIGDFYKMINNEEMDDKLVEVVKGIKKRMEDSL